MLRNYALLVLWIMQATAENEGGRRGACELNARMDFSGRRPPVILTMNASQQYQLAEPSIRGNQNSYISVKNKTILLACPGKRNSLILDNRVKNIDAEASCKYTQGHNYFKIEDNEYQSDQVNCTSRVTPTETITGSPCNDDGILVELGYTINNEHYNLIQTCHRVADGMTYYSRHRLDGSHFSRTGNFINRPDNGGRPGFSFQNRALYRGFPPNRYYRAAEQQMLLTKITENPDIFDNKHQKFFSKGHLTPNADFILSTWRDVTFLYVNTAPQWQDINGKNWDRIEKAVRNKAVRTGETYEVVTGTHGVLLVNGTKLYLDFSNQRLPVPQNFIKLVREVKSNQCMAFISNNFPLEEAPVHKCEDVCLQYDWPNLKDYKRKGYVYCCLYEELKTAFRKTLPLVDCTGGPLKGMDTASNPGSRVQYTNNGGQNTGMCVLVLFWWLNYLT